MGRHFQKKKKKLYPHDHFCVNCEDIFQKKKNRMRNIMRTRPKKKKKEEEEEEEEEERREPGVHVAML